MIRHANGAARADGLGDTAVHEILRANDLKPHLQRTFKISRDPEFIEKVEDIVGLYLAPPRRAFVVCMDEKTQVPRNSPWSTSPARSCRTTRRSRVGGLAS